MTDTLVALSIRQPWAHAIVHAGKDIENRTRCHRHRGLTLVHASAGMTEEEYRDAQMFVHERVPLVGHLPGFAALERGGIIGAVDIVDCVDQHDSPWWMGPRGYVLQNPRPVPFFPCQGTVTPLFWVPPPEAQRHVRQALSLPA